LEKSKKGHRQWLSQQEMTNRGAWARHLDFGLPTNGLSQGSDSTGQIRTVLFGVVTMAIIVGTAQQI
jgi:hypothetical protein